MENGLEKKTGTKKLVWIVAGVMVVVLLTGAAFMAGQLMQKQSEPAEDYFGFGDFKDAGLPEEAPITSGMVSAIDGDTLTVQEFGMDDSVGMEGAGGVQIIEIDAADIEEGEEFNFLEFIGETGPSYEVVITHETKIYKDVTSFDFMDNMNPEAMENMSDEEFEAVYANDEMMENFEFKIEESTANEIGNNSMVTVWGEKKGDRIIASVILFQPMMDMGNMDFETP